MTGAWDDPAVRQAVQDEVMAAAGVAAATTAVVMSEQLEQLAAQVAEGRARRARREAEAPARAAHLLEQLTRWDIPRDVALSVLGQAWHEGWSTGFWDADRGGPPTPEPFPA